MQVHITDEMIDASISAARAEAIADGQSTESFDNPDPQDMERFRQVIKIMLQAAANTIKSEAS